MDMLVFVNALVVILGGILACSALIVAQKPDARQILDKLAPFQALIGVGMVGLSLVNFLRSIRVLTDMFKVDLIMAAGTWAMLGVGVVLGALLGVSQIMKLVAGNPQAQQRAYEMIQKVAPFQVLLGLAGIGGSVIVLLFQLRILK
jgi:hypothetical protein